MSGGSLAFDGCRIAAAPAAAASAATSVATAGSDGSEEARKFRSLPEAAQRAVFRYPELLRGALLQFAGGATASDALDGLMDGCPEMLTTVDNQLYRESPLGRALLRKRLDACWKIIRLAERRGVAERVLRHRNSSGHTLLMLAVDLDSLEAAPLLEKLLADWPEQVHACYDTDGRNVFHHCAAEGRAVSLRVILQRLGLAAGAADAVATAFGVPDGVERQTPIHYMAGRGALDMLRTVEAFLRLAPNLSDARIGDLFNQRGLPGAAGRTPLELAEAAGARDVCQWLRDRGAAAPAEVDDDSDQDAEDEEEDEDEDEPTKTEADAAADDIERLTVVGRAGRPLSDSARQRLLDGLRRSRSVGPGDKDTGRLFAEALASHWPPLRAGSDRFLSLSADPAALCVSLVMAGSSGGSGDHPPVLTALAAALRDVGREDLLSVLAADDRDF